MTIIEYKQRVDSLRDVLGRKYKKLSSDVVSLFKCFSILNDSIMRDVLEI